MLLRQWHGLAVRAHLVALAELLLLVKAGCRMEDRDCIAEGESLVHIMIREGILLEKIGTIGPCYNMGGHGLLLTVLVKRESGRCKHEANLGRELVRCHHLVLLLETGHASGQTILR